MSLKKAINIFTKLIKIADAEAELARALIKFIAQVASDIGVADHSYIVGGSVRDFIMGVDPKDIDIVVETKKYPDGEVKNAVTLAKALAAKLNVPNVQADQYGVVHIGPVPNDVFFEGHNFKGQKIEIVTARKEKYDKGGKSSHKPTGVEPGTIEEDLKRRDFTFNTMTWKLSDLTDALETAPINDLLGGKSDLSNKIVKTPLDPIETFSDDPSRMLRAIRFAVKYDFEIDQNTKDAIKSLANEIKRMPWEPIGDVFVGKILKLGKQKAIKAINMMDELGLLQPTLEMSDKTFLQRQIKNLPIGNDADFLMFFSNLLDKYNIKNFIYKFPHEFKDELFELNKTLSPNEFQSLYDRLQSNVINTNTFINEFGLKGAQIGKLIMMAKKLIVQNPAISQDELEMKLKTMLSK